MADEVQSLRDTIVSIVDAPDDADGVKNEAVIVDGEGGTTNDPLPSEGKADTPPSDGKPKPPALFDDKGQPLKPGSEAPKAPAATTPKAPAQTPEKSPSEALVDASGKPLPPTEKKPEDLGHPAPSTWKPLAKEQWKDVPEMVKLEVMRREKQAEDTARENGRLNQELRAYQGITAPYQDQFKQANINPVAAVKQMMDTTFRLMHGSASEKASLIAQAITNYKVDVELLDQVLTHEYKNKGNTQPDVAQLVRDAVRAEMGGRTTSHQAPAVDQQTREAQEALDKFAQENVYFDYVQDDMVLILNHANSSGTPITMKEAYEKACRLNPTVSRHMELLEAQKRGNGRSNIAPPMRGAPGSNVINHDPKDLRGTLEAAFNRVS